MIAPDNPFFGGRDLKSSTASGFNERLISRVGRFVPGISLDLGRAPVMGQLRRLGRTGDGVCLIVGAGSETELLDFLRSCYREVVVTDVVQGPDVSVVCDGAELPFEDAAFDCVIAMAVLEHVLDPETVIAEFHRVLKPGGVVAADTPFMQQVHMRAYDFTRFTDLGYRWLFRRFEEAERGVSVGPGSALAWSIMYFFRAFAWNRMSTFVLTAIARLGFFWLKYFDYILARRPGGRDAAAGFYFVGIKRDAGQVDNALTAADLPKQFSGL
ncbi:MAG: class I SAM-dependent methyltransferase [Hyphomicrobiaceae bacterium]|nr:class I SAM-dependent methyltransferase [Hyphomicrobiaceae bacterium]